MKAEIEKLIEIGKEKFKSQPKTEYYIHSEHCIVYSDAINLLLEKYNPSTEKQINKIFEEQIPKLFDNKECEHVLEHFENLKSSDVDIRRIASKFFQDKALSAVLGFRAIFFQRPDTFEQLMTALKHETEQKIIINLIVALGCAYQSYFSHFRVYETLLPYFSHKKSDVRYYTVIWTKNINNEDRTSLLQEMYLTEKSKKVRKALEDEFNPVDPKEFYKRVLTPAGETEFQVRFLKNEGVGLLTTKNDEDYLVLDSADYWDDLVKDKYPPKKKCKCKHEWFEVSYFYTKRAYNDDIKNIEVLIICKQCNKISTDLYIDIDYSPTDTLLSEPITLYSKEQTHTIIE